MNVHKHMEAIFVVALAVVGLGSLAIDGLPEAGASAGTPVIRDAAPSGQAVVMCSPKAAPRRA